MVLAEDERHQRFIRRYLNRLGYHEHDIAFEKLPSGRGCGEQWVRRHYVKWVKAYRQRSANAATALVVAIAADTETVSHRQKLLEEELAKAGVGSRGVSEKVVHLIPKRHVETWIICLGGVEADEWTDYKGQLKDDGKAIRDASERLFEWSRPNATVPPHCIPSLREAISEVQRLDHK